jgi:peptidoglycan/xylan/chitin deacetylase (PgdA/CDA1 family)
VSHASYLAPDRFAIFLFHGVVTRHRHRVRNYTRKHLDLARFEAVLDELVAHGTPVSLDAVLASGSGGGVLPARAFVVTFDDGFANNVRVAAPLLARRAIPATFYVTTAFVDGGSASWTDMIEYAVDAAAEARLALPPPLPGGVFRTPEEKIALLDAVRAYVKGRPEIDPYAFATDVWRQLGIRRMEPDAELDRKMSWDDVRWLDDHPLFTVGGHGHTHRILGYLSPRELAAEIDTSLAALHAHLGHPVRHYSYPEGLAGCYSDAVIARLGARGVIAAPTAEPGVNRIGDDPFRLKRVLVA